MDTSASNLSGATIAQAIDALVDKLATTHRECKNLVVAGIANGGIALAHCITAKLSAKLGREIPCGTVNITFQRDDIGQKPIPKITEPTELPFDIRNTTLLLVDDVLFTGRTARAALNEIFDQGRPSRVELVILFDRGNRRLPIQPDHVAFTQTLDAKANVRVTIDCKQPDHNLIEIIPHES